jgi:hypothetical protein
VAALTLDAPAEFVACIIAGFIFIGAADSLFSIMDDSAFDAMADSAFSVVAEEEIMPVGNGNENIRISNLRKKDRNIRRTAEMR